MASELPRSISIHWGGLSPEFHVTSVDRSTAPDGGLPGRNREAVAGFMVDELFATVDVQAELAQGLPPRLQPLAGARRDAMA